MQAVELTDAPAPVALTEANRILVVEDEDLIREMLQLSLTEEGYCVTAVADGRAALGLLLQTEPTQPLPPFDLVVLDLMLPQVNGLDLCRLLRRQGNATPILILSARGSETDRVLGLEVGADDYLIKPFSTRELIARCRALLRRQKQNYLPQPTVLHYKDIYCYPQQCRVTVRGEVVNLSPKEFRLLELFMNYPRRVWSRESLLDRVWGADFVGDSKTVDVHIRWLRQKLERDPSHPEYILTVRGFGYRFG